MSEAIDWDAEARRAANLVGTHLLRAHRGAMPWEAPGTCAVFGNDGYADDPRARREVELVRDHLRSAGLDELGFGVCDEDGCTWALLVRADDHEGLFDAVWDAWGDACNNPDSYDPFRAVQSAIAAAEVASAVAARGPRPSAN
jgi:hypothetical protein